MNPEEYAVMAEAAEKHWWYLGLRDILRRSLTLPSLNIPARPRILDAGCGTGENLRLYKELFEPRYLGGFDASETALIVAREKAPYADVYHSDLCDPEIHSDTLDLITSLDVLYIPGLQKARSGLHRLVSRLVTGGVFVINLPAFNWLSSEHDLAVHTSQRFTMPEVEALLSELGLHIEIATYRLFCLFPAIALSRLWRNSSRRVGVSARSDLQRPPGPWINSFLTRVLYSENALIAHGTVLPFGSSVFAVGRKLPSSRVYSHSTC